MTQYLRERPTTYGPIGMTARLIVAWTIVGVPLAWGVTQTVQSSLPLFTQTASPTTASPATMPGAAAGQAGTQTAK